MLYCFHVAPQRVTALDHFFSLVYINDMPNCLRLTFPRMFADDTNITFAASTLIDLEKGLNTELRSVNQWLISNKLSLNVAKNEFMVTGSNQRLHSFSDDQINIEIDAKLITKVKEAKSHNWQTPLVDALRKKMCSAIGALKRIRPFISEHTALQIYQVLILPHLDYCSSVLGDCNLTLSNKLQKLQNRAARAITRSNYDTSASFLLNRLNLDDLITRRQKLKPTFKQLFNCLKQLMDSPQSISRIYSVPAVPDTT